MKKIATIIGLVALAALPACSNMDGHDHDRQAQNQGQTQDAHHMDWKAMQEKKAQAMTDYFFSKADTNQDGVITWAEYQAFTHKMFREADANHDHKLTRDEVLAMKRKELADMHDSMHGDRDGANNADGMTNNTTATTNATGATATGATTNNRY